MYIVSRPKPLSDGQNQALAKEYVAGYPPGYLRFLRQFGEGTYRGWLNVQLPDREVLKPLRSTRYGSMTKTAPLLSNRSASVS